MTRYHDDLEAGVFAPKEPAKTATKPKRKTTTKKTTPSRAKAKKAS